MMNLFAYYILRHFCIIKGKKTLATILAYAQGYEVEIKDGKIKKAIDKAIEE